ncbi:hypothetical protein FIBSPDRAFT_464914 [Athelia psychrophila]|uniref:Secreted protein n=1 Tax=Athelia psychrophila TaxID=1759441 RepID=A0A167U5G6_9AGAM|nr:hypothetical protein FIBSPDRAFT_464914 [Fibularhizoctonia sp. CBS 109695]
MTRRWSAVVLLADCTCARLAPSSKCKAKVCCDSRSVYTGTWRFAPLPIQPLSPISYRLLPSSRSCAPSTIPLRPHSTPDAIPVCGSRKRMVIVAEFSPFLSGVGIP